jgi:hypothetical protein
VPHQFFERIYRRALISWRNALVQLRFRCCGRSECSAVIVTRRAHQREAKRFEAGTDGFCDMFNEPSTPCITAAECPPQQVRYHYEEPQIPCVQPANVLLSYVLLLVSCLFLTPTSRSRKASFIAVIDVLSSVLLFSPAQPARDISEPEWLFMAAKTKLEQQMQNTNRRGAAACGFFLLSCFAITTVGNTQNQAARSNKQTNPLQAAIVENVQKHFGATVEVVTAFQPFNVVGDFNGDGAQDVVVVVRIKARRNALPTNVKLLNPFGTRSAIKFPTNPDSENKLALAIVHSWKTGTVGKFLLLGESPVLIMQYARATSSEQGDKQNLINLMSKRGRRPAGVTLPIVSKGDVILLATEVGSDSLLYWNGRTYVWEDVAED